MAAGIHTCCAASIHARRIYSSRWAVATRGAHTVLGGNFGGRSAARQLLITSFIPEDSPFCLTRDITRTMIGPCPCSAWYRRMLPEYVRQGPGLGRHAGPGLLFLERKKALHQWSKSASISVHFFCREMVNWFYVSLQVP